MAVSSWQRFSATVGSGATAETVVCLHDARQRQPRVSPTHQPNPHRQPAPHAGLARPRATPLTPWNEQTFSLERCSSLLSRVLHQLGIRQPVLLGSGFRSSRGEKAHHPLHPADHPNEVDRIGRLPACRPGLIKPGLSKSELIKSNPQDELRRSQQNQWPSPQASPAPREVSETGTASAVRGGKPLASPI